MRIPLALCALALISCSRSESTEKSSPAAPVAAPPAAPANSAEPAKPVVEDTTFRLALQGAPEYAAGQQASVQLTLEARGGYHVNEDYPIRVDIKAPAGVKFAKSSFARADAAQFGEHSAKFELPFTAEPGKHDVLAEVDFAVCTKETCVPDQRTVALALTVK